jgi:hypothetical protein
LGGATTSAFPRANSVGKALWLRLSIRPTVPNTDVWPFRQIFSSIENMQSAPASGTSTIQARAMLRVEKARLVPVSASLFMDLAKAFGRIWA